MTAIRERQSASPPGHDTDEFENRSAFGPYGIPLWGAVLVAVLPTALGSIIDILAFNQPGVLFKTCFFLGSLGAVLMVKRANVFGPMVQPPLVLGITMPLLVLLLGSSGDSGGGLAGKALEIARPLITSFPIMAGATVVTLGIGLIRMFVTQKRELALDPIDIDPEAKTRKQRPPASKKPAGNTSAARADAPGRSRSGEQRRTRGDARTRDKQGRERQPRDRQGRPDNPRGGGAQRGGTPTRGGQARGERAKPTKGRDPQGRPSGGAPRRDTPPGGRQRPQGDPRAGGQPPRRTPPGPTQRGPRPPEQPPGGRPRRPR